MPLDYPAREWDTAWAQELKNLMDVAGASTFTVTKKCLVRQGFDTQSEQVGMLDVGTTFVALGLRTDEAGRRRARLDKGWVTVSGPKGTFATGERRQEAGARPSPQSVDRAGFGRLDESFRRGQLAADWATVFAELDGVSAQHTYVFSLFRTRITTCCYSARVETGPDFVPVLPHGVAHSRRYDLADDVAVPRDRRASGFGQHRSAPAVPARGAAEGARHRHRTGFASRRVAPQLPAMTPRKETS